MERPNYSRIKVELVAERYEQTREVVKAIRYDNRSESFGLVEGWAQEDAVIEKCDLDGALEALLAWELGRGTRAERYDCVRLGVMAGFNDIEVAGKLGISANDVPALRRQGLEFLYLWLKGESVEQCGSVAPECARGRVPTRRVVDAGRGGDEPRASADRGAGWAAGVGAGLAAYPADDQEPARLDRAAQGVAA